MTAAGPNATDDAKIVSSRFVWAGNLSGTVTAHPNADASTSPRPSLWRWRKRLWLDDFAIVLEVD